MFFIVGFYGDIMTDISALYASLAAAAAAAQARMGGGGDAAAHWDECDPGYGGTRAWLRVPMPGAYQSAKRLEIFERAAACE